MNITNSFDEELKDDIINDMGWGEKILFSEIAITSSFKLHILDQNTEGFSNLEIPNVKVKVSKAKGEKCQRCWKYDINLVNNEICNRCNEAIS